MEDALGGDGLAPLAVRHLRAARRRLDTGAYDRGIERDLQAAVGELAELTGWLLHDAGQLDAARTTDHEALFLARLAGDRSTELFILANLSYLDTSTHRPAAALQIARSVLCAGDLSNRLQAIFGIREARARAMLGDRPGTMNAIERIHSRSTTDPPTATPPGRGGSPSPSSSRTQPAATWISEIPQRRSRCSRTRWRPPPPERPACAIRT
jgi:hypothetical protein